MNSKKGFTLIELLVVIAIIGILASIVLASLTAARQRGQAAAVQSSLSSMRAQAELYYSVNGSYSAGTLVGAAWTLSGGIDILPTNCSTTPVTNSNATLMFASGTNTLDTLIKGACTSGATAIKGGVNQLTNPTTWAVTATAPGGNYYCVDNTGASKASTSLITISAGGVCP